MIETEYIDKPASAAIELKVGQWYRQRGRVLVKVVYDLAELGEKLDSESHFIVVTHEDGMIEHYTCCADGIYIRDRQEAYDLIEHLPSCTGFDWQPETFTPVQKPKDFEISFELPALWRCGWCHEPLESPESTREHSNA